MIQEIIEHLGTVWTCTVTFSVAKHSLYHHPQQSPHTPQPFNSSILSQLLHRVRHLWWSHLAQLRIPHASAVGGAGPGHNVKRLTAKWSVALWVPRRRGNPVPCPPPPPPAHTDTLNRKGSHLSPLHKLTNWLIRLGDEQMSRSLNHSTSLKT